MNNPENIAKEIVNSYTSFMMQNDTIDFDQWAASPEGKELIGRINVGQEGEGWVSVKDRLPEIPKKYYDKEFGALIVPHNINVIVWDGEDVYEKSFGIIDWGEDITHWQYFPPPPKPIPQP